MVGSAAEVAGGAVGAVLDDGALMVASDDSAGGAGLGDASFAPQLASSNPINPTQSITLFFIADPPGRALIRKLHPMWVDLFLI